MSEKKYEMFLAYFNSDVLAHYKSKPNQYDIYEENYGGSIYNNGDDGWREIRYAFRKLEDGNIAVAGWIPDLNKLPETEAKIWAGFQLEEPQFLPQDKQFEDWLGTYLSPGGFFPVTPARPKAILYREVALINAITRFCCNRELFKVEDNPLLHYPQAENKKSYTDSVLQLNNLVNDMMDHKTIETIASHLSIELDCSSKRLNSIKQILNDDDKIRLIHQPLKDCNEKRAKVHGVSKGKTESFEAFEAFDEDVTEIGIALKEFKTWLEGIYSVNADACLRRFEVESYVSELEEQSYLKELSDILNQAESKTIQNIKFGKQKSYPNSHESEGINFHFTDGTTLFVRIGANSQDIANKFKDLEPNDIHTSLMFNWAPAIKK